MNQRIRTIGNFGKKELVEGSYIFRSEGRPMYFMDDYDGENYSIDRENPLRVVYVEKEPLNDYQKKLPVLAINETDGSMFSCGTDTSNGGIYEILEEESVEIIGTVPELEDVFDAFAPYATPSFDFGDGKITFSFPTGEAFTYGYDFLKSFMSQNERLILDLNELYESIVEVKKAKVPTIKPFSKDDVGKFLSMLKGK